MIHDSHAIQDFLSTQSAQIPLDEFCINLLLAALLAFILGWVYVKFGNTLSNREMFARNFVALAMTTMLIITIVKSSLALSLGLVGALSIIRFRAAIKEPEELTYLFLAISLGLGFGAGQTVITTVAFVVIVALLALKHMVRRAQQRPNFYLTVSSSALPRVEMPKLMAVLTQHAPNATLRRLDETAEALEASFHVQFDSLAKLEACNNSLRALSSSIRVSYMEERGIGV
jgi:uncharacterized membrane protein YhiD involved in acid resistance